MVFWRVSRFCNPGHGFKVTTGQSLPKAKCPTGGCNIVQGSRSLGTFGSNVARPHLQNVFVRISVERLHARDHTLPSKPRNLGRAGIFDVLDSVAGIFGAVGFVSCSVTVQSLLDGAIADGVREDLKAAAIPLCNCFGILFQRPNWAFRSESDHPCKARACRRYAPR